MPAGVLSPIKIAGTSQQAGPEAVGAVGLETVPAVCSTLAQFRPPIPGTNNRETLRRNHHGQKFNLNFTLDLRLGLGARVDGVHLLLMRRRHHLSRLRRRRTRLLLREVLLL